MAINADKNNDQDSSISGISGSPLCLDRYREKRELLSKATSFEAMVDLAEAFESFTKDKTCPLDKVAKYRAAETFLKAGRLMKASSKNSPEGDEKPFLTYLKRAYLLLQEPAPHHLFLLSWRMLQAEVASELNQNEEVISIYRALLLANSKTEKWPQWAEVSARLALALDQKASHDKVNRSSLQQEARELVKKVVVESPQKSLSLGSDELFARLNKVLHLSPLNAQERLLRIESLLKDKDALRAKTEANELLSDLQSHKNLSLSTGEERFHFLCKVHISLAKAQEKIEKKESAVFWSRSLPFCKNEADESIALFNMAKIFSSRKNLDEAINMYSTLEKTHPSHRLADDAALKIAFIYLEQGKENEAISKLESVSHLYPDGDMGLEAGMRALALLMKNHEDAKALNLSEELGAKYESDGPYGPYGLYPGSPSRPPHVTSAAYLGQAHYFNARLHEKLGHKSEAQKSYAHVISHYPFSYYMIQAYSHLHAFQAHQTPEASSEKPLPDSLLPKDFFGQKPETNLDNLCAEKRTSAMFSFATWLALAGESNWAEKVYEESLKDGDDPLLRACLSQQFKALFWFSKAVNLVRKKEEFLRSYPSYSSSKEALTNEYGGVSKETLNGIFWRLSYPNAFEKEVELQHERYQVSTSLIWAIMREESLFVADAQSVTHALGLMQMMGKTAKWMSEGTDLPYDNSALIRPEISIELGSKLLSWLSRFYQNNTVFMVGAYNAGQAAIDRWIKNQNVNDFDLWVELIPYDETRNYIKRVYSSFVIYTYLNEPHLLRERLLFLEQTPVK